MRKAILALIAVTAAGVGSTLGAAPAAAYDYPWCAQGRGYGIPGDCSYPTYQACQASVSGRDLYCNVNPRVAYGQQPEPRQGRSYRNYHYQ
jgi:hypothetical protein